MVPVRQATYWRAVTILPLLSVRADARVMLVAVSVRTGTQLLSVAVAKLEMALAVSCQ